MVKVVISGAGPAGLLLAQNLIQQPNYDVHVFEKRPDLLTMAGIRSNKDRTYPMCIQGCGNPAIAGVPGLRPTLEKYGKWIDKVQTYKGKGTGLINKSAPSFFIERNSLACGMLEHLRAIDDNPAIASGSFTPSQEPDRVTAQRDPSSSLSLHFDCGIADVSLDQQTVTTDRGTTESFDHIVGADGATSVVRTRLKEQNHFTSTMSKTSHSYRSLAIPTDPAVVQPDRLHSWFSIGGHQLVVIPIDGETARGLYVFPNGDDPFEDMTTPQQVIDYFRTTVSPLLADAIPMQEAERILAHPVGCNLSVQCNALTTPDGKAVLIGDAAHAMSSSLALGCNSAMHDVQVLCSKLAQHDHDWHKALQQYNADHMAEANAVREFSDHSVAVTTRMRLEFMGRMIAKRSLPTAISKHMRSMPIDVMSDETKSFTEMLEQSRWWTDRVKASKPPMVEV
uniref:FAD-binding domain-containing protein n=1 Tax=Craspedostauros australis TaxID=1486917 RepID=A0A7R9WTD2_9STRA